MRSRKIEPEVIGCVVYLDYDRRDRRHAHCPPMLRVEKIWKTPTAKEIVEREIRKYMARKSVEAGRGDD